MRSNPQMAADGALSIYTGSSQLGAHVDSDTWLTPTWILDDLGAFDLDPCAFRGNPTRIAPRYFLKEDDGLMQPWTGRVFCNPPFSKTNPWIRRHADHGSGISLVPASIESSVWRDVVWKRAHAIKLLAGRTKFCNPDGSTTTGRPLRPVALIAWSAPDAESLSRSAAAGVLLSTWEMR